MARHPPETQDEAETRTPSPGDSARVLVVEDNPDDRWYFAEILRSLGYTVISCSDPESAWSAFLDDPPPLIFLDLLLPGMGGIDLCRRVRSHPQGEGTVIVAVTAAEENDLIHRVLEAGADDFVRKPVDPAHLETRMIVAERLGRERAGQRRAQAALETQRREVETLFQSLHDVFFSVDLRDGSLVQISAASWDLFGYTPEELMKDPALWRRFLLPPELTETDSWTALTGSGKDAADDSAAPGEAGAPGAANPLAPSDAILREYPIEDRDGNTRWVRATLRIQNDARGRPLRAHGTVADVTHERVAAMELARRNEELAALYRIAETSLTSTSLEEAYAQILDQISELLGVPIVAVGHVDELRDRLVIPAALGIPLDPGQPLEEPLHGTLPGEAVRKGIPVVEDDPRTIRDRGLSPLAKEDVKFFAAFPLVAGGDVLGALVLAGRESVQLSAADQRLTANLATAVASYLERLEAEAALRESEARHRALAAELQQANEELEAFAYSVSHDLRAPLRTMQGFGHALLQEFGDSLPPEARGFARRIIASGKESEDLISDLLDYSRMSFERLDPKPVELKAVVDTAMEQLGADLEASEAQVEVAGPLPTVLGSHTALVQVVTNLVSNALKFVPEDRKPRIRIRTEDEGDAASMVRLIVEDNGIGVPQDRAERIFGVFERLESDLKRPGTGIGLAIVRRAAQRMGGACGVEAVPEGGSAFWFTVPRERRETRRSWMRRTTG
ncbi:MAG: ATP-binding protein [Gemmatimonadota bacterium]